MTANPPSENIANKLAFFCQDRFKFQNVGMGSARIMTLWKILRPAAT
jgi:hypothetical protein